MTYKRFAFCLVGLLLLMSEVLIGQDSQQFTAFFAKFKSAAAQKDAATLTTLMMPNFNFVSNISSQQIRYE